MQAEHRRSHWETVYSMHNLNCMNRHWFTYRWLFRSHFKLNIFLKLRRRKYSWRKILWGSQMEFEGTWHPIWHLSTKWLKLEQSLSFLLCWVGPHPVTFINGARRWHGFPLRARLGVCLCGMKKKKRDPNMLTSACNWITDYFHVPPPESRLLHPVGLCLFPVTFHMNVISHSLRSHLFS